MADGDSDVQDLELSSIIGFDGNAMKGLNVHPDGEHIVYPFGVKVAIHSLITRKNRYLEGHNNVITTIAISKTGTFVGSGQVNHMGFKAPVFVWNFNDGKVKMKHESHKVRVENVEFSCCERYIISLGGKDDANVVVFDIESGDAICGVFSSNKNAGDALTIGASKVRNLCFFTGGVYTLKLWTLNPENRNAAGQEVQMGKIRRKITTIKMMNNDLFAWCGTSTGDIMKVKTNFSSTETNNYHPLAQPVLLGCYAKHPKVKKKLLDCDLWVLGVRAIVLLNESKMVVGAGNGTVDLVRLHDERIDKSKIKSGSLSTPTYPLFAVEKTCYVGDLVTSMDKIRNDLIIIGNIRCEILFIDLKTFASTLILTCHVEAVYDIAFPSEYSNVFATASKNDIRLWNAVEGKELLRITVPNFTCSSLLFTHDGRSIVSGWNDGTVRAFTPQSGKLIYTIINAHNKGVSALGMTKDGGKLLTGGVEGQVRIWCIRKNVQNLLAVLKEHKGPVSSVAISPNSKEAASSSTDGSCIIWDIVKNVRLAIMFSTTLFLCIKYHPSGCQLITSGTNRLIGYWETFDGSLIREVEGSRSAAINTLAISRDGKMIVSGGNDQFVKVWKYKEGMTTHVGLGHGAVITCVAISPDERTIVSASADGAIFIWKAPVQDYADKEPPESTETVMNITDLEVAGSKAKPEEIQAQADIKKQFDQMSKASSTKSNISIKSRKDSAEKGVSPKPIAEEVKSKRPSGDKDLPDPNVSSIKCYCKNVCTCDKTNMPKTPKSDFAETKEEIIRDLL